jgi:hypothetical protein
MVTRNRFRLVERMFHILIELFGKVISIINSKYSLIEVNILSYIEILPGEKLLNS